MLCGAANPLPTASSTVHALPASGPARPSAPSAVAAVLCTPTTSGSVAGSVRTSSRLPSAHSARKLPWCSRLARMNPAASRWGAWVAGLRGGRVGGWGVGRKVHDCLRQGWASAPPALVRPAAPEPTLQHSLCVALRCTHKATHIPAQQAPQQHPPVFSSTKVGRASPPTLFCQVLRVMGQQPPLGSQSVCEVGWEQCGWKGWVGGWATGRRWGPRGVCGKTAGRGGGYGWVRVGKWVCTGQWVGQRWVAGPMSNQLQNKAPTSCKARKRGDPLTRSTEMRMGPPGRSASRAWAAPPSLSSCARLCCTCSMRRAAGAAG